MRESMRLAVLFVVVAAVSCAAPAQKKAAPKPEVKLEKNTGPAWRTFHGDSSLSGFTDVKVPDKPAKLWGVKLGGAVPDTPVVGDGRIFCPVGSKKIIVLDMAGKELWRKALESPPPTDGAPPGGGGGGVGTPLIYTCGMVVFGTGSGSVVALDGKSGRKKWQYETGGVVMGTPNYAILDGGAKCVVTIIEQQEGVVHGIDARTGEKAWIAEPTARCDGSAAVADGKVVFGSCAAAIHVLDAATGKYQGDVSVGEGCEMAGALALADGRVYSGNRSGTLVCGDVKKAEEVWTNEDGGGGELFTAPAVSKDRVVFFGADGTVYGLDRATGKKVWSFDSGAMVPLAPVIAGDKAIVMSDGKLVFLSLADGKKGWSYTVGDEATVPAVVAGKMIVGTGTGEVIMFGAK